MLKFAWINTVNEWLSPFRAWFVENSKSPLFWIGYFVLGIIIFTVVYKFLNRDN